MDTHRAQVNPSPSGSSCLAPQLICSYILRPVAFLMGVAWEDCPVVAELLGMKLFLNEFVAYQGLSEYKQRRLAGTEEWVGSKKQWISVSVPLPLLGQGPGIHLLQVMVDHSSLWGSWHAGQSEEFTGTLRCWHPRGISAGKGCVLSLTWDF